MVKPKNKHSLSHVRHDPAHCLAPGLFRALKRGERKRSKLDVTYDYGDGKRIEFSGPEPLVCYSAPAANGSPQTGYSPGDSLSTRASV